MFEAARHHDALARAEIDGAVAEFDAKPAFPDHEELVLSVMMVTRELALHLDDLHLLAVGGGDDLWPPMLGEQTELLVEIDLGGHRRGLATAGLP